MNTILKQCYIINFTIKYYELLKIFDKIKKSLDSNKNLNKFFRIRNTLKCSEYFLKV